MEIYPILNKPGKGKYVFIFILNERAVTSYFSGLNIRHPGKRVGLVGVSVMGLWER